MTSLLQNLRFAFRSLRKVPAFALTVVSTLAIAIGLNAAIFTVVDNVLLRPLGYRDAERIVALQTHFIGQNRSVPRLGAAAVLAIALVATLLPAHRAAAVEPMTVLRGE